MRRIYLEPRSKFARVALKFWRKWILARCIRTVRYFRKRRCQLLDANATIGLHRNDRHAESLCKCIDIDLNLPVVCQVDHVKRHNRGQTKRKYLTHQKEIP